MKKTLAFFLIICVFFALAACKSEKGTSENTAETSAEADIGGYSFTGEVYAIEINRSSIVLNVCDEYVSDIGGQVTVTAADGRIPFCWVGDEVRVTVDDKSRLDDDIIEAVKITVIQSNMPAPEKPVIYLYPEKDTVCSVRVDIDGKLTCTYPDHGNDGWQDFVAKPDGALVFPNGREYYCLYWEGIANFTPDFSTGFCVKGSESAEFLERILAEIGLTEREANEFILYWLPRLEQNEYNLISFNAEKYCASARLEITPTPDSILRVFMSARAVDSFVEIEPEGFDSFDREGFTVVEWGGCIVE